jgi:Dolichyl-phosphate-mannose-protein mannosyltransferase
MENRLTATAQPDRRLRPYEFVALAVVLGLAAYLYRSALLGFFVQDDFGWLYESRFASFREYLTCFFRFSNAMAYRPLSQETFFLVGQKLFGLQPFGFHLGSLAFHLAGVGVLYLLLRRFAGTAAALAVCVFYSVHSAHCRSVGWIAAVPEPMALFFYVSALLFFVRFDREDRTSFLVLSVAAMMLGVMSKESILTVPLVLAAYCLLFSPRRLFFVLPHLILS